MKRLVAALLLLITVPVSARAADGLTVADAAYLDSRFGLRQDDAFFARLSRRETAELHGLLQSRTIGSHAFVRDVIVGDQLVRLYQRQCADWARARQGSACPPGPDASIQPGKDIADRECNSCHLFGTGDAPAFFSLARSGTLDEARIARIAHHDPRMATLRLSPGQVRDITAYINSLK